MIQFCFLKQFTPNKKCSLKVFYKVLVTGYSDIDPTSYQVSANIFIHKKCNKSNAVSIKQTMVCILYMKIIIILMLPMLMIIDENYITNMRYANYKYLKHGYYAKNK